MKTKYNISIIFWIVFTSCALFSCKKFVIVDQPNSQLFTNSVFQDRATANAAIVDIYAEMKNNGLLTGGSTGLSVQLGNYADELDCYIEVGNSTFEFFNNNLLSSNDAVYGLWKASYNQIYAANSVIKGVQASTLLTKNDINELTGEALFIRALLHFYLLNLYGDIPYVKSTDYQVNNKVTRKPVNEVYTSIIADLEEAKSLLSENYIGEYRVRPNRSTVRALLARVYLYSNTWDKAEAASTSVIDNIGLYSWIDDLDKVFLRESNSTIWQLMPPRDGNNTLEGATFIFTVGPPNFVALNDHLIQSFEDGDLRKIHWISSVTDGNKIWYHPNKYKQRSNTASSEEYSIIFRLSEQYLIRAEARARLGDLNGARLDLNKVRSTAGLGATKAVTLEELIDSILKERRSELFTEFGHRFFDLKRTGNLNVLLGVKPGWKSTNSFFPIPEIEMGLNPNLKPQNAGY